MGTSRWSGYLPPWLQGRWGVILGVSALAIGGAALGWPWLVAIGAAPILLTVLLTAAPCAVSNHSVSAAGGPFRRNRAPGCARPLVF